MANPDSLNFRAAGLRDREVRQIASLIFEQLQTEGCQANDIIGISTQLIDMVTDKIKLASEENSENIDQNEET